MTTTSTFHSPALCRNSMLARVREESQPWDMIIIGGGATGLGVAVDAANRGYRTLLLEKYDFAKGTSSRSTKLVHGGVRYLQQGNVPLVREALHERGLMRRNAPHLVHDLSFIVPAFSLYQKIFYGVGLKTYDLLSGKLSFGKSRVLGKAQVGRLIPNMDTSTVKGGILYHDGQFDDARLALNLAQTAAAQGAVLLNYAPVQEMVLTDGKVTGVVALDEESGEELTIRGKVVINATGPFSDTVRRMEDPDAVKTISASQGIHLVLKGEFLQGETAIMIPKTDDGRVLFAIPWHGHTVVGTTDTPIPEVSVEPRPLREEIDFVLSHAQRYMAREPQASDVLSVFVGIRPLVCNPDAANTAALSRDHSLFVSKGNLVTICGGKWTTYRRMAEDTVNRAAKVAALDERPCATRDLHIHGYVTPGNLPAGRLAAYGSDAAAVQMLEAEQPELAELIHPDLPVTRGQIVWAARHEMARTVEDALSRRTRALLFGARASRDAAPEVARLLAAELGHDEAWQRDQVAQFSDLARQYELPG